MAELLRRLSRSLAAKFAALAVIFLVVPLVLYARFAEADAERQAFLLRSLQAQGRLAAQRLEPVLSRPGGRTVLEAAKAVRALEVDQVHVKLLLRPARGADGFFLVAASPEVDSPEAERERLDQAGVLPRLDDSCQGDRPLALRYAGGSGQEELLTSLSPLHTAIGCWVVITSYATDDLAGSSLARPFAQAPEVRLAMAFYGLMALLMAMAVTGTMLDLRAFARLARRIRQGRSGSFTQVAAVPELLPVAREFDSMVATLDASARSLREAAEDNAHAFKAPIAVITQSLEPLRRAAAADQRAGTMIGIIEQALGRLTNLVTAARHLDVATADLMNAHLQVVDLARLATDMARAYDCAHASRGIRVTTKAAAPRALVLATAESLETVIENLLDNAISFSPPGGTVRVRIATSDGRVRLEVEDDGPGVPAERLGQIFRRSFSYRPSEHGDTAHSGIGLTVVRRNIELLGGSVMAENVPGAGLRVSVALPAA